MVVPIASSNCPFVIWSLKSNGCNAANAAEPAPTLLTVFQQVPTRLVKILILLLI